MKRAPIAHVQTFTGIMKAKDVLKDRIQRIRLKADNFKRLLHSIKWDKISEEEEKSLYRIFSDIKP